MSIEKERLEEREIDQATESFKKEILYAASSARGSLSVAIFYMENGEYAKGYECYVKALERLNQVKVKT